MAHYATLLIDLTLGERLQILGERRGVCTKVAFASDISDTTQARAKVTTECQCL